MHENPPVSVIITAYNCEKYLAESIKSILDQTYSWFELIIINDGSIDKCDNIIRSFKDGRIRYISHRDNKNIPIRRNEAINLAKGIYIAIQDADNISLPDRLEQQWNFLRNNLAYFCIGGHAAKINTAGHPDGDLRYPPVSHEEIVDYVVKRSRNPMIDSTVMFRRRDFLELGGYTRDMSLYTAYDMDLWLKAILCGKKFVNLPYPVIKYRVNPEGFSHKHQSEIIRTHMIVWRRFIQKHMGLFSNQRTDNATAKKNSESN